MKIPDSLKIAIGIVVIVIIMATSLGAKADGTPSGGCEFFELEQAVRSGEPPFIIAIKFVELYGALLKEFSPLPPGEPQKPPLTNANNLQSEERDPSASSGSRPGGGSCPYLYVWNGDSYVFDNDIMPFKDRSVENTNYYRIQQALIPEDGYYKVRIAEELPETSYLDSVQLFTVDHPSDVDVYPDLRGNIYNISHPQPLRSCVDGQGNDQLSRLMVREQVYTPGSYFEGKRGDYIVADFGDLSGNSIIKLVITSDGPLDDEVRPLPGKYSSPKNIYIESLVNRDGITDWETHFVFSPHERWATNVFDITTILPDANGDYKLRFFFTNTHKVDFIGIDTSPEVAKEVHRFAPVYARAGEDVLSRVANTDNNYLVMRKGDELFLKFPYQPQAAGRANFKRDFVFVSRGYYILDVK